MPDIEIVQAGEPLASLARIYFDIEQAAKDAFLVRRSSWGDGAGTDDGEDGLYQKELEAKKTADLAWINLRNAMPDRYLNRFYEVDNRLFGYFDLGGRYVFRVKDIEQSASIKREAARIQERNNLFSGANTAS
jgi:hypothetical protein